MMLLRMVSDPKSYSPKVMKSLSLKEKRHQSDGVQKTARRQLTVTDLVTVTCPPRDQSS